MSTRLDAIRARYQVDSSLIGRDVAWLVETVDLLTKRLHQRTEGLHTPMKHYWYQGRLVAAQTPSAPGPSPKGVHGEFCSECELALARLEEPDARV